MRVGGAVAKPAHQPNQHKWLKGVMRPAFLPGGSEQNIEETQVVPPFNSLLHVRFVRQLLANAISFNWQLYCDFHKPNLVG